MSIYKNKTNGKWEFQFTNGRKKNELGKVVYKQVKRRGFDTKQEAEYEMRQLKNELERGYKSSRQSFTDFINWWFPRHQSSGSNGAPLAKRTIQGYKIILDRHLIPYFGHSSISDIHALDIEDYLYEKKEEGLTNQTLKSHYRMLHLIFEHAVRRELISNNIVRLIPCPRPEKKSKQERSLEVLTVEDQAKLVKQAQAELDEVKNYRTYTSYILAHLGLNWGLRISELLALKWTDITDYIDADKIIKIINIQRAVDVDGTFKTTKSISGERSIPIDADLFKILMEYKQWLDEFKSDFNDWEDNQLIIPSLKTRKGRGVNGGIEVTQRVSQQMRGLFARSNVAISMHGLRHTCITNWLTQDVPIKMVSTLAGHSSISITLDRYGHLLESDSVKFMDKLYARMHEIR